MRSIKFGLILFTLVGTFQVIHCDFSEHIHKHDHNHHPHTDSDGKKSHSHHTSSMFDFDQEDHDNELDSEALLGGRQGAKAFAEMQPSEARVHIQNLMQTSNMDKDGNGLVSFKELLQWIKQSFEKLSQEESDEMFEEEDSNHDGKLHWSEHYNGSFTDFEDLESNEMEQLMREDKIMWQVADLDKDGFLDKLEYALFSSPEDHEQMHEVIFNLTLERKDHDGDGRLSFEEYILNDDRQMPDKKSDNYLVEKERFEKDLDLDKDGYLDREEIMAWIVPNNSQTALVEAEHLMELCDDDKNDQLSIDELSKHIFELANSEATNFGEHFTNLVHDEL